MFYFIVKKSIFNSLKIQIYLRKTLSIFAVKNKQTNKHSLSIIEKLKFLYIYFCTNLLNLKNLQNSMKFDFSTNKRKNQQTNPELLEYIYIY
jgi:hypothetical protein